MSHVYLVARYCECGQCSSEPPESLLSTTWEGVFENQKEAEALAIERGGWVLPIKLGAYPNEHRNWPTEDEAYYPEQG